MYLPLVLLLGDRVRLLVGEPSADGTGLLVAQVEGKVCGSYSINAWMVRQECRKR